jgi:carbonic anhydrase
MKVLKQLFDNNRAWAENIVRDDPEFFSRLSETQVPDYLWIGCSDSRVPANEIVGLPSGDLFVHRNVANLVVHTDLNCLSVLQYAVDVLKVPHVIVCGHYGCGGVRAALGNERNGLIDNWLRHVQDVAKKHHADLASYEPEKRHERLCELNVIEQVLNVCQTTIVQDAWARGQELSIHGWIYRLADGRLNDLGLCVTCAAEVEQEYVTALVAPAHVAERSVGA